MKKMRKESLFNNQNKILVCLALLIINANTNNCGLGCSDCLQINSQFNCQQCLSGYKYDSTSNTCIYSQCGVDLYFQVDQTQNNENIGTCVSICNPFYEGNSIQNTCERLQECSSTFQTDNNLKSDQLLRQFFIYKDIYYLVIYQQGYLSLYDKEKTFLIQHYNYDDSDLYVQSINEIIFVLTSDNTIFTWDLINETRVQIFQGDKSQLNQKSVLFKSLEKFVLLLTQREGSTNLEINVIYDIVQNSQIQYQKQFNLNIGDKNYSIINDFINMIQQNLITVQKILVSNDYLISLSPSIICSNYQELSSFMYIVSSSETDKYYAIYKNGIMKVDINKGSCTLIQILNNIQKVKVFSNPHDHLLIQTTDSLIDLDSSNLSQNQIKIDYFSLMQDFDVGKYYNNNNQIIILISTNILYTLNYSIENQIFQQIDQRNIQIKSNAQIIKVTPQNGQQNVDSEIALFNKEIQIIRKIQGSNDFFQFQDKLIKNYQLQYPSPSSQINSLVIIYETNLVVACHSNGDIVFYSTSSGYQTDLIQILSFQQQSCLKLDQFKGGKLIALMQDRILFINSNIQIIEKEIQSNQTTLLSFNYDKLVINKNNCIEIFNQDFTSLFNHCNDEFSSNNLKIELNSNLQLFLQKQNSVQIYQIDLDAQSYLLLQKVDFQYNIIFFTTVQLFTSDQNKYDNKFDIEEVITYDSNRTFSIYDNNLNLLKKILNIPMISVNQVKRTINDNNVYFMIGSSNTAVPVVKIQVISKLLDTVYQIDSFQYSPYLDDPIKIVNDNGTTFYHVKHIMQMNFFTVHEEFQIDLSKSMRYVAGLEYINYAGQSLTVKKSIGSNKNDMDFALTKQGQLGFSKWEKKRYEIVIKIPQPEVIQEIIQSSTIGMYFVRTNLKISSYNIFTNQFIEDLNPFSQSDPIFNKYQIIELLQSIICLSINQILLSIYSSQPGKYYYKDMKLINGWLYNKQSNIFYIYGNQLVILNTKLEILNSISDPTLTFLQCIDSLTNLICSTSLSQFIIVDKSSFKIVQTTTVKGFTTQFLIGIDQDYDNIFLYAIDIQAYTKNGVLKQTISPNKNILNTFAIHDTYIVFFSKSNGVFLDRNQLTLQNSIAPPAGLNIINYIYIKQLKQIVLYCNNSLFASLYIYNLLNQQLIGKISVAFPANQIGVVLGIAYDEDSSYIQFLDDQGNYYIFAMFDDYTVYNVFKLTEVIDRKESLISFTYDNKLNNVLIYSKNYVYQINYSLVGFKYEFGQKEPSQKFSFIRQINENQNEYLLVSNQNMIFRYTQQTLITEQIKSQSIQDIRYDVMNDILIIAFQNSISILTSYQDSIKNNIQPKEIFIQQIQFFKFITNSIYLTFDKKIIHCNIKSGEIIQTIQLDENIFVTSYISNSQQNIVFIGLSNGKVLQYNLIDKKQIFFSISDSQNINKSVNFIQIDQEDQQQQKLLFATNGGIVVEINLQTQLKNYEKDLIQATQQEESILMIDFHYDKMFQRYIFFFSGEKKAYVWNQQQNILEKYLILTNNQGNHLKLTQSLIITQCSFQLNIYSREKNINLITYIQRNNFNDFIIDYQIINDNFIAIFFNYKYEVFLIQDGKNIMIDQQQFNYPRFMGNIYNPQTNFMKIYGLHSTGVFEENYSLNIYQLQNQQKCSSLISSNTLQQLKHTLNIISPKMQESYDLTGRITIPQNNWKNNLFLNVNGDSFQNINQFLSQPQFSNTNVIFLPQKNGINSLKLNKETLSSFEHQDFILNNFNFIFDMNNQNQLLINFNPLVKTLKWQDIKIQQQVINKINIYMDGLNNIAMKNISFEQLSLNLEDNNNQDILIIIKNTDQVYLYDINIANNQFSSQTNQIFFQFENINSIIIDGLVITDNINIYECFKFSFVKSVVIKNVKIKYNKLSESNQQKNRIMSEEGQTGENQNQIKAIFSFYGCSRIQLFDFEINNNQDLIMVYSNSEYKWSNNIIALVIDELVMKNIQFNKNQISNDNSLLHLECSQIQIINIKWLENQGNLLFQGSNRIQIEESYFQNNTGLNGGAIQFIKIQSKISFKNTQFQQNTALGSGGSIYFEDIDGCIIEFDSLSEISKNKALIGGGIRIVSSIDQKIVLPINYPFSDNIKNNSADIYGNNAATYLESIIVENLNDSSYPTDYEFSFTQDQQQIPENMKNQYKQIVQLKQFQSGSFLRLKIYIVDDMDRKLSFSKSLIASGGYPNDVMLELKNIQILIEVLNIKETQLLGEKILNYDQYNSQTQSFELRNLQIQAPLDSQQYFAMNSNILAYSNKEVPTLIDINFRKCQIGEIIQEISDSLKVCKFCSSGSYSLLNPDYLYNQSLKSLNNQSSNSEIINKNECIQCPESAVSCEGKTIHLRNGYWRADILSDEILECDSKIGSCKAESPSSSIEGCSEGYLGPLCEECDITGEVWNQYGKRYSQAVQKGICEECANIYLQYFYLFLKIGFIVLYFILTLRVFIHNFKYTQRCYYLRIMQLLPISKNSIQDYSGFYIKIIITYLQISSLLIDQPKLISADLNIVGDFIGSSNRQISLGIDCLLSQQNITQQQKLVMQILTQALIPVILIILIFAILRFLQLFKIAKINKYFYITFMHIHLNFFQLEQISYFSKSLTCRQIGSKSYAAHDLTIECNKSEYQAFLTIFAILMLLIWSLLPLFGVYMLQKQKKKLNECKVKYLFGFYYAELKTEYYFWEFVRMYMKITIIYIHILLSQKYETISNQALILVFSIYAMFVTYKKPFISTTLTKSEFASSFLIVLKIFLSNVKENISSLHVSVEILIALIDYIFMIYLLITIVIFKANNKTSKLGLFISKLLVHLPKSVWKKVLNLNQVKFKTYLNWKLIKFNLKVIIQQQANQNMNEMRNKAQATQVPRKFQLSIDHCPLTQQNSNFASHEQTKRNSEVFSQSQSTKMLNSGNDSGKSPKFQFHQRKISQFQSNQDDYYDQIIETKNDQLEFTDPKKIESYLFFAKNSILTENLFSQNNEETQHQ